MLVKQACEVLIYNVAFISFQIYICCIAKNYS